MFRKRKEAKEPDDYIVVTPRGSSQAPDTISISSTVSAASTSTSTTSRHRRSSQHPKPKASANTDDDYLRIPPKPKGSHNPPGDTSAPMLAHRQSSVNGYMGMGIIRVYLRDGSYRTVKADTLELCRDVIEFTVRKTVMAESAVDAWRLMLLMTSGGEGMHACMQVCSRTEGWELQCSVTVDDDDKGVVTVADGA